MCAGAIVHARLRRVIYGCLDPKTGGAGGMISLLQMPPLNHQCEITRGVREDECREILQRFFKTKRGEAMERNFHHRGTEDTEID